MRNRLVDVRVPISFMLAIFAPGILLFTFLLPILLSAALGAYLFYAQHNFPAARFRDRDRWDYVAAALEATAHPATGPALYFVATGNGGHAFAATMAEQERNVAAYRAFQRQLRREAGFHLRRGRRLAGLVIENGIAAVVEAFDAVGDLRVESASDEETRAIVVIVSGLARMSE